MRIFILSVFVFLVSFKALILPQEKKAHKYVFIALSAEMLTDSSMGGTGFNAAPDANRLQIGIAYPWANSFEVGPTLAASFNATQGADSLKYTALGIKFSWMFAPRFSINFNPEYAVWERAGFNSWINLLFGLNYGLIPNRFDVDLHFNVIDGKNPMLGIGGIIKI